MKRCKWTATIKDEEYLEYHDKEWSGAPLTKGRDLFELLCLEGAQAGLSWQTILKKRKNYRKVFKNFDIESVVKMNVGDVDMTGIVKHHGKVKSVIQNALSAQTVVGEFGSLHAFFKNLLEGVDVCDPAVTQAYVLLCISLIQ